MAHDMIDRGADRFRKSLVIQRGRDGLLHPGDVFVADSVEFTRGDTGFDIIFDHIQHIGGQATGDAHFFLLLGAFYRY